MNASIMESEDQPGRSVDNAMIVLLLAICIVGTIGNILIICMIAIFKEYKKLPNWHVLQLAIADLMFLLTLPFSVDEAIYMSWRYNTGLCKAKETSIFLNYFASMLFLTIMSIDRYVAVCHSRANWFNKAHSMFTAYVDTVIIWLVALLVCIPIMMYSEKAGIEPHCICSFEFPNEEKRIEKSCGNDLECRKHVKDFLDFVDNESCINETELLQNYLRYQSSITHVNSSNGNYTPIYWAHNSTEYYASYANYGDNETGSSSTFYDDSNQTYYSDNDFVEYYHSKENETVETIDTNSCHYWHSHPAWIVFVIFNSILFFAIPLLVKMKSDRGQRGKSKSEKKSLFQRNQATIMCATMVSLFVICWLPFHAVHLAKIRGINVGDRWCNLLPSVASLVAFMNSALNPYIYYFMGTGTNRGIRSVVKQLRKSLSAGSTTTSSNGSTSGRRKKSSSGVVTATTKIYKKKNSSGDHKKSSSSVVATQAGDEASVPLCETTKL